MAARAPTIEELMAIITTLQGQVATLTAAAAAAPPAPPAPIAVPAPAPVAGSVAKRHEQNNLAKFTSHLIKDQLLSLTCLKVIEFSELNKNLVKFIKHILLYLQLSIFSDNAKPRPNSHSVCACVRVFLCTGVRHRGVE